MFHDSGRSTMANQTETTPDTPATEPPLPPGGGTAPTARTAVRPVPRAEGAPPSERARAAPAPARNGRAGNPAEMRAEIARTRARLSGTLDALEARIVQERESLERKKGELLDKATLKPLRARLGREPWRSMAIAFVAGYIVAALRD